MEQKNEQNEQNQIKEDISNVNNTNNTNIESNPEKTTTNNLVPNTNNNPTAKAEDYNITTFRLGEEKFPVDNEAEVIEYINARIRALENLENCKNLKVN